MVCYAMLCYAGQLLCVSGVLCHMSGVTNWQVKLLYINIKIFEIKIKEFSNICLSQLHFFEYFQISVWANFFMFPHYIHSSFCHQQIAILLLLIFKEISLRPELSSRPRFKIQGGSVRVTEEQTELLVSYIGYDYFDWFR